MTAYRKKPVVEARTESAFMRKMADTGVIEVL